MNLRQLKSKIKSIKNVGQITKAMQLVSAVKMKKTQIQASQGKPYREALEKTIENLVTSNTLLEHELTRPSKQAKPKRLAIVISSNKGLCGVFNFNLFKFLDSEIKAVKDYDFVVVGIKAQQFLFHYGANIVADFSSSQPFEENTSAIFTLLKERFIKGENNSVELYYNSFVSSLVTKPAKKILLPLEISAFEVAETKAKGLDYQIEPSVDQVLNGMFDFYLESLIRGAIQESEASEHSARMIAMKNATDNSNDLVYRLTLTRNSIRQEKITNELLDMNTARLAVSQV